MKRGANSTENNTIETRAAKKVRFEKETTDAAATTTVQTNANAVTTNSISTNTLIPQITPARTAAGLGGLGWGAFCLAFGSAPATLPVVLATVAATTTITLAPFAAIKAGKAAYNYFTQPAKPETPETPEAPKTPKRQKTAVEIQWTPEWKKIADRNDPKKCKKEAIRLHKEIGELGGNVSYFNKLKKIAKTEPHAWKYAYKSLFFQQHTTDVHEKAEFKKAFEAKAKAKATLKP